VQEILSRKEKILVVDDEPTQRLLLSNLLQSVPYYQVTEAHDGLSALETLEKEEIGLIILDVRMPVMDGFETLAAIREKPELSHIPVIMCTAVNGREEVVRILQQGVAAYIVKPINKQTLLPKVQCALATVDDAKSNGRLQLTANNQTVTSESHHTQQVGITPSSCPDNPREYIDYLASRIDELQQQYYEAEDSKKMTSLGRDLNTFGEEYGFPQIALLAEMLIQESKNNHWNLVEALIQQLLREQKKIAEDSVQSVN